MLTATHDRPTRVGYRVHVTLEGKERRYHARDKADARELGARIRRSFPEAEPVVVTVMSRKEER